MKKPKIIHQIWIGKPIPDFIQSAMQGVKARNPNFEYMLWDDTAIDIFDSREEFDACLTIAFFVDILRLKILEKYGGLYIDADYLCLESLDEWYLKYQELPLYSSHIKDIYPEVYVIIADPGLDYTKVFIDLDPDEPMAFYWQRMLPGLIPDNEIGLMGTPLRDLRMNSWKEEYEENEKKKIKRHNDSGACS